MRAETVIGSAIIDLANYASPEGHNENLSLEVTIPKQKEIAIVSMNVSSEWLRNFQGEMSEGGSQTDKSSVAASSEDDSADMTVSSTRSKFLDGHHPFPFLFIREGIGARQPNSNC